MVALRGVRMNGRSEVNHGETFTIGSGASWEWNVHSSGHEVF